MKLANKSVYPVAAQEFSNGNCIAPQRGMTLLEHYAGLAMQTILSKKQSREIGVNTLARFSVEAARALIAELEKEQA